MQKLLVVLFCVLGATLPTQAQLKLSTPSINDPITGLPPDQWEQMISHILDSGAIVGEPGVLMISSISEPLTVSCGKWNLVGQNLYKSIVGNPPMLRPFSVTYVKTQEFDGYCKEGVIGHTPMGRTVIGKLTSSDGSFTNASIILFSASQLR